MTAAQPLFPALPPHLVPTRQSVREQAGARLLSELTDYSLCAPRLSHREAAQALQRLYYRLPGRADGVAEEQAPSSRSRFLGPAMADDAAHDRYIRVGRVSDIPARAFLGSVVLAAQMFYAEMDLAYHANEAQRFAEVGAGLTALLAHIVGLPSAPVAHSEPDADAAPPAIDPMTRWVQGHQIFVALTQGIIYALQEFERAATDGDEPAMREGLKLAADLLIASATAFRFTADFPADAYRDIVRPSMMAPAVGEGFSGLLSVDHRRLVAVLLRVRPLMGQTAARFATEHARLGQALNAVYDDHRFVCAQFGGAQAPSLRCPNSSSASGVEQLERYRRARVELLRPSTGGDTLLLE